MTPGKDSVSNRRLYLAALVAGTTLVVAAWVVNWDRPQNTGRMDAQAPSPRRGPKNIPSPSPSPEPRLLLPLDELQSGETGQTSHESCSRRLTVSFVGPGAEGMEVRDPRLNLCTQRGLNGECIARFVKTSGPQIFYRVPCDELLVTVDILRWKTASAEHATAATASVPAGSEHHEIHLFVQSLAKDMEPSAEDKRAMQKLELIYRESARRLRESSGQDDATDDAHMMMRHYETQMRVLSRERGVPLPSLVQDSASNQL